MMPLSIRMSGSVPELDRKWFAVDCPVCRLATPAQLGDVRHRRIIICRGCKSNIRLVDGLGSYARARQRIRSMLRRLGE